MHIWMFTLLHHLRVTQTRKKRCVHSTSDRIIRLHLNASVVTHHLVGRRRQRALSAFASGSETTEGALGSSQFLLILVLELLDKLVNHTSVKVFDSDIGVTGFDL